MRVHALVVAAAFLLGVLTGCRVSINIGSGDESPTLTPPAVVASPATSEASPQPGRSPVPSPISTPRQAESPTIPPTPTFAPTPTPPPPPPSPTPPPPPPTPTPGFVVGRSTVQDWLGDATDEQGQGPPVALPVDLKAVTLESDGEQLQMTFEAEVPISETLPPGVELLYNVFFDVEGGWSLVLKGTNAGWEIWASDGVQVIDVPNAVGDWSHDWFVVRVPWAWIPFLAPEQFHWSVRADWLEGEWHWFDMTDTAVFPS